MIRSVLGYGIAILATSTATAVIVALDHVIHIPDVALLYLPAILFVAVTFGTWPSLLAATLAVLQYDFFLLQPIFTFSIGQVADILAFVIFVIVAILTSQLAARARERAEAAQRRAKESTTLYELGQALMSAHQVPQILQAITERIVQVFGVDRCAIYAPDANQRLTLAAQTPAEVPVSRTGVATAAGVWRMGTPIWLADGNTSSPDQRTTYVPLRAGDEAVGVMEIGPHRGEPLDADEQRLALSFAAQAALVIARAQNEAARHRLEVVEESDRLKSALLNAVSHDLRTPLASIKTSATTLLLADAVFTPEQGREFLQAINQEADRLNRLVGNLLDLSRIEAGVLRPVLEWYEIDEILAQIVPRIRAMSGDHPLSLDIQQHISAVQVDLVRIEALVINLGENAVKYTPPGTPVCLRVRAEGKSLKIAVIDHGPGVPPEQRRRIFTAFAQGYRHGDRQPGSGLGLAICRGVAEAHGGAIAVQETPGGGATFEVCLPLPDHASVTST